MRLKWKLPSFYYGWWLIGVCFLMLLLMGGFVVLGFTAFFEPISKEFGWNYAEVSLAGSFRGVEVGIMAPLVGLLIDRWGPRRFVFIGVVIVALALMFLSTIHSLGLFYLGYVFISIGMSGYSPTVIMTVVANWFRKKMGIATGVMGTGFAVGGLTVPIVVKLIDNFGWRMAFFIMGAIVLAFCLPLSLLLRHKPEQYGYALDGDQSVKAAPSQVKVSVSPHESNEINIDVKQALKTRTFWYLGLPLMFQYTAICMVTVHVMPYLESVGLARSTASFVATAVPLASIAGRLSSGWLADKFSKKQVTLVFVAIMVLGLVSLGYSSSNAMWLVVAFIILYGIGWGGNNTMRAALVADYFGRNRFGSIFGFIMGLTAVGAIGGPYFAGWAYDHFASYHVAWLAIIILISLGMIVLAYTPHLKPRVHLTGKQ